MDDGNPLPGLVRQILIGAGLFVLGGLLALGFSYRPLYGSLVWRVDALEQRIDERNRENLRLGDELAKLRAQDAERIEPEQFAQLERELEQTQRALAQAEKDHKRAERKRKDANASASRWRKRYETLRDEARTAAAQAAAPTGPPSPPAAPTPSAAASAAPRPTESASGKEAASAPDAARDLGATNAPSSRAVGADAPDRPVADTPSVEAAPESPPTAESGKLTVAEDAIP